MNIGAVTVSFDTFMQWLVMAFLVGLLAGLWEVLSTIFEDGIPPLRQLGDQLLEVSALVSMQRTADQAQQAMLAEGRRRLQQDKD
jgi:hypothetical protein